MVSPIGQAQTEENKTVIITVSGTGQTKDEAKEKGLRNAIEQAFGTFISSKTEILNDEIVADQMSSVSSGNIKSYEVLNESQLPNGTWASTLRVIVSVDKLTSFVEAKGITVEIKGGLFALNIKQQLLNEQGEINAIAEMVGVLHEPMQTAFDYTIKSGDPKSLDAESKNWEIPLTVTATANKNMDFCANYFIKTLSAISLSASEVETYKSLNKKLFSMAVNYNNQSSVYYLRKQASIDAISFLTSSWEFYVRLFTVESGIDDTWGSNVAIRSCSEFYRKNDCGEYKAYEFLSEKGVISFPLSGQNAGSFNWMDKRTLNQIEQLKGYAIKPRGIVSPFKFGGCVLFEENGHGIVFSVVDFVSWRSDWNPPRFSRLYGWNEAMNECEQLILNGYSDWRLPKMDEMKKIYKLSEELRLGNFNERGYWTSTKADASNHYYADEGLAYVEFFIHNGEATEFFPLEAGFAVRAVRSF